MVTTAETQGSCIKITGVLRGDRLLCPQGREGLSRLPFHSPEDLGSEKLAEGAWSSKARGKARGHSALCGRFALVLILPLLSTSIEGEYVPVEGDEVTYKMCPIPPKNQKFQAVEVVLTQLAPHTPHETWSGQVVGS